MRNPFRSPKGWIRVALLGMIIAACCMHRPLRVSPEQAAADAQAIKDTLPTGPVFIRLRNASETDTLKGVWVGFPDGKIVYGDLLPLKYSDYIQVRKSYSYAYIQAQTRGSSWTVLPADFVGEKMIPAGRYTWEIKPHAGEYPGSLDLNTLEDKGHP